MKDDERARSYLSTDPGDSIRSEEELQYTSGDRLAAQRDGVK